MIAIFYNEQEAIAFSEKIHDFLKKNRKDYNAERWSDVNKSESENKWAVKIPDDSQKLKNKLLMPTTVKENIIKLPDNWVKLEKTEI